MNSNICTICGYSKLREPPRDETRAPSWEICPCCGSESGYHDYQPSAVISNRKKWIENGAHWFDNRLKPKDWDLRDQLRGIGVDLDNFFDS